MLYANSSVPLYRQLFLQLRSEIENRDLPVGERLPSERELAALHGISRLTARRALQLLQQAGYVDAQQGRGSFVISAQARAGHRLAGFTETVLQQGHTPSSAVLRREVISCDDKLAAELEVRPGSQAVLVCRLRMMDGRPTAINTCYLPYDLCHEVLAYDLESNSLYGILERELGFRLQHADQSAVAVLAGEGELRLLALHPPAALLALRRHTHNDEGRVVEYSEILYAGEQRQPDIPHRAA